MMFLPRRRPTSGSLRPNRSTPMASRMAVSCELIQPRKKADRISPRRSKAGNQPSSATSQWVGFGGDHQGGGSLGSPVLSARDSDGEGEAPAEPCDWHSGK